MNDDTGNPNPSLLEKAGSFADGHNPASMLLVALGGKEAKALAKRAKEAHAKGSYYKGVGLTSDAQDVAINHIMDQATDVAKKTLAPFTAAARSVGSFVEGVKNLAGKAANAIGTRYSQTNQLGGDETNVAASLSTVAWLSGDIVRNVKQVIDADRQALAEIAHSVKNMVSPGHEVSGHDGVPTTPAPDATKKVGSRTTGKNAAAK